MKNKFGIDFESCLVLPPPPSENSDLKFCASFTQDKIFKKNGFTLAEILLSLSIIGIVAAIALPSLLGNVHERAFETQKKALYTRFSQSLPLLPSLNGYGELKGTLGSNSEDGKQHVDVDTAAESFVRDGLSKVMKITNICDSEHLADCGLPDKIITLSNTAVELSNMRTLCDYNGAFHHAESYSNFTDKTFEQLNIKAAAFETVNGESILTYYNPNCEPDLKEKEEYYAQTKMCANFVYDLNGKKGPNTVGKDIGFITAMYSTDPIVVAPVVYPNDLSGNISQIDAAGKCKEMDVDAKLPNIDELSSIFYNRKLFEIQQNHYWSSNNYSSTEAYLQGMRTGLRFYMDKNTNDSTKRVRCIKR